MFSVPTSGGPPRKIAQVSAANGWALLGFKRLTWSPDSRYLYYVKRSNSGTPSELFRVPAAGGKIESTGFTVPDARDLSFSPDGTHLAFSNYTERPEIWVLENFLPHR